MNEFQTQDHVNFSLVWCWLITAAFFEEVLNNETSFDFIPPVSQNLEKTLLTPLNMTLGIRSASLKFQWVYCVTNMGQQTIIDWRKDESFTDADDNLRLCLRSSQIWSLSEWNHIKKTFYFIHIASHSFFSDQSVQVEIRSYWCPSIDFDIFLMLILSY